MEIVTNEVLPVEASMSGANTCYLHCPSLNRRSNYGVCLYTIRAYNREQLSAESDCYSLVGRGLCEALTYQKQEQEAGRALFFKAREIKVTNIDPVTNQPIVVTAPSQPHNESYMRGWNQVGDRQAAKKVAPKAEPAETKAPKKSAIFGTETVDLSDAVDVAVKADMEAKAAPKPTKKEQPASKATVRPGMSILERARMMAGGF